MIAGTGPDEARLRESAAGDPRIKFLGFVNDDALLDLYAGASAVLFVPLDEDFGLVALEAMKAGKPVLTTRDAGGATHLVLDGETGFIVDPTADAIAQTMDRIHREPELARAMGEAGRLNAAEVTWDHVCRTLLDGLNA
jgi:glycosyltransferase involved in cell wall biosynthesis